MSHLSNSMWTGVCRRITEVLPDFIIFINLIFKYTIFLLFFLSSYVDTLCLPLKLYYSMIRKTKTRFLNISFIEIKYIHIIFAFLLKLKKVKCIKIHCKIPMLYLNNQKRIYKLCIVWTRWNSECRTYSVK